MHQLTKKQAERLEFWKSSDSNIKKAMDVKLTDKGTFYGYDGFLNKIDNDVFVNLLNGEDYEVLLDGPPLMYDGKPYYPFTNHDFSKLPLTRLNIEQHHRIKYWQDKKTEALYIKDSPGGFKGEDAIFNRMTINDFSNALDGKYKIDNRKMKLSFTKPARDSITL